MNKSPWRPILLALAISFLLCAYCAYVYVRPTHSIELAVSRGARVWLGDELLGEDGCHCLIPLEHPRLTVIQNLVYTADDVADKIVRLLKERGWIDSLSSARLLPQSVLPVKRLNTGDGSAVYLIERSDGMYEASVCQVNYTGEGEDFLLLALGILSQQGEEIPIKVETHLDLFADAPANDFRGRLQKLLGCPDRVVQAFVRVKTWASIDELIRMGQIPGPASQYPLRQHCQ